MKLNVGLKMSPLACLQWSKNSSQSGVLLLAVGTRSTRSGWPAAGACRESWQVGPGETTECVGANASAQSHGDPALTASQPPNLWHFDINPVASVLELRR